MKGIKTRIDFKGGFVDFIEAMKESGVERGALFYWPDGQQGVFIEPDLTARTKMDLIAREVEVS